MSETLKPCPFCGVDDIVLGHKVTDDLYMVPHSWYIKCRQCGCTLFDFDSDEEAIKAWNHRAERTCKMEVFSMHDEGDFTFRCSECGKGYVEYEPPRYCPNCGAKLSKVVEGCQTGA